MPEFVVSLGKQTADKPSRSKRYMVVYQAGIANVFHVERFGLMPAHTVKRERIYQGDFRTAEVMTHGMSIMGAQIRAAACNQAGDIASLDWDTGLEHAPFRDAMHPAKEEVVS